MAPVTRAANRLRSTVQGLHTCVALHRFESRGHSRCVFPSCLLFVVSTFLPPLAPRALPRFSATTEALSPSGRGSSGLLQTMNAAPSPDRGPRFMSLQLPTILSPPTLCTPVPALTVSPQVRPRSCRIPSRVGFRLGLRHFLRMLANASGRIEFIIFLIMDWLFASDCPPPRLSATQLPSAQTASALSDGDFHPAVGAHFQAHGGRPSQ